ncbi:ABC transporter substrate-binding protein [Turicimonas sp. TL08]
MKIPRKLSGFAASMFSLCLASSVLAAELNLYATMPDKYASEVLAQFSKDTGIKVNYLRLSAGEVLARVQAEKNNPQVDAILGGPADIYEAAKKENLVEPFLPKNASAIPSQFIDPDHAWIGIGIMPLAFISNSDFLKRNGLKAPQSWMDLLDPKYKNSLILADARTSGTATERLFSIRGAFGKEGGIEYQKKLHKNVQMYTKSGAWPALRVGQDLAAVAIVYLPDALDIKQLGHRVEITYPKEGVTFGIEAVGLVRGAKHPEEAKKFIEWASSPKFADFILKNNIKYVPTRTDAVITDPVLNLKNIKALDVPLSWKGEKRKELTDEWINQVLPTK